MNDQIAGLLDEVQTTQDHDGRRKLLRQVHNRMREGEEGRHFIRADRRVEPTDEVVSLLRDLIESGKTHEADRLLHSIVHAKKWVP